MRIGSRIACIALSIAIALGLFLSVRYLPPIDEMPPWDSEREGQNWIGQGGWAHAGYMTAILLVAYVVKRLILTHGMSRGIAVCYFFLAIMLSLPYIWFFCEPDWFHCFIYRTSCWVGGPIAIWLVPTVSFLVDLPRKDAITPLKKYLIRSGIECLVAVPLWLVLWSFLSFLVLGWGWI